MSLPVASIHKVVGPDSRMKKLQEQIQPVMSICLIVLIVS